MTTCALLQSLTADKSQSDCEADVPGRLLQELWVDRGTSQTPSSGAVRLLVVEFTFTAGTRLAQGMLEGLCGGMRGKKGCSR